MPKKNDNERGEGRVLFIDDEESIRESLSELLTACGFQVLLADSYKSAVGVLGKNEEIEAIVCDLKMPGKSGIEVLKHVNGLERNIPLIFLTGYGTLDTCQEAVREGAFDYILKPIDNKDKVIFPLRHAVEKYRLEKMNKEMHADILRMAEEHKRILEEILDDAEIKEKIQENISRIVDRWR